MTLKGWIAILLREETEQKRFANIRLSPAITRSLMSDARITLEIAESFGGD
jgi:hypothetical protein